jgi:hypothetical protein
MKFIWFSCCLGLLSVKQFVVIGKLNFFRGNAVFFDPSFTLMGFLVPHCLSGRGSFSFHALLLLLFMETLLALPIDTLTSLILAVVKMFVSLPMFT